MQRFDQTSAVCQLFTYKEGVLSYLAHDLRISVTSFIIEIDGTDHFIDARFDARSLRVDCVIENNRERPDLLSPRDRDEIDNIIIRDLLHPDRYPEIVLVSSSFSEVDGNYLVNGPLSLHGQTKEVSFVVQKGDSRLYVSDIRLHLPDFGITPFSAFLGAIKVKPDVLVHVEIPIDSVDGPGGKG